MSEDDIATQRLNELRERARKDFSEVEINDFINVGKKLASKAILSLVICMLKDAPEAGLDAHTSAKLIKKVKSIMPYDYSGYVSISFKEIPYTLNICLSLADRDYKTDIDLPHENYIPDLFKQYNFLKGVAVAYWKQIREEHPELIERIANYLPAVDFSVLQIDPQSNTSLYFDPAGKKRVSLFCYYLDQNGTPFYKRRK